MGLVTVRLPARTPEAASRQRQLSGRPRTIGYVRVARMASADRLDSSLRSGSLRLHEFLPLRMYINVGCRRRRRDLRIDERTELFAKLRSQQPPCGSESRAAHVGTDAGAIAVERVLVQSSGFVLQK